MNIKMPMFEGVPEKTIERYNQAEERVIHAAKSLEQYLALDVPELKRCDVFHMMIHEFYSALVDGIIILAECNDIATSYAATLGEDKDENK